MAAMANLTPDDDADTRMTEETDHEAKDTARESRCIQLLELKTLALHAWAYCRYGLEVEELGDRLQP